MFPTGKYDAQTIAKIGLAAHGMSVVGIERVGRSGQWRRDKALPATTAGSPPPPSSR